MELTQENFLVELEQYDGHSLLKTASFLMSSGELLKLIRAASQQSFNGGCQKGSYVRVNDWTTQTHTAEEVLDKFVTRGLQIPLSVVK